MGTEGLGSGFDAEGWHEAGSPHQQELCTIVSGSHTLPRAPTEGHRLNAHGAHELFFLLPFYFGQKKETHNLSLCECGKSELGEHNRTLHCNRVIWS